MPILKKTPDIWTDLLHAITSAESEILLQTFYIDNDEPWETFANALIEKSLAGIKVTCLFDALGSRGMTGLKMEENMRTAGVRIIYFNWLTPWSPKNKSLWYFRNHKRSLIVDGKTLHIGGWCIGDRMHDWIDANVVTSDPQAVQGAIEDFQNMYLFAHKAGMRVRGEKHFVLADDAIEAYAYQAPLPRSRYIVYAYLKLIRTATKNITLIAPYFAPTQKLMRQLILATKRGVRISLVIPKRTDHKLADIAAQTYFHKLLRHGVGIYLSPVMIHAKVSLFDDTAYVGSMNLDAVSIRFNFENGLITRAEATVAELRNDTEKLETSCELLSLAEWEKRGLWRKFVERVVRVIRGFL